MNMTVAMIEKNLAKNKKLENFLRKSDDEYRKKISEIDLFDIKKTSQWTDQQKKTFARMFYHARGHFYKFLWYIGSRSSEQETKEKIIENIKEEFSETNKSHDLLYLDFAKNLGVNLDKEIYEENFYRPFLREFDKNHIKWIVEAKSEASLMALLSAYERLDNIDYANLLRLAKSIGVSDNNALLFFVIHSNANHFDRLFSMLESIWEIYKEDVIESFNFIYENQLKMWISLSNEITSCQ